MADKLSNTLSDHIAKMPDFIGSTVTTMENLTSGTLKQYTIPSDGFYFVTAVNTSVGALSAYINADSDRQVYIQAAEGGSSDWKRVTTGVVPFKKNTVIYVFAVFTSYGRICKLT